MPDLASDLSALSVEPTEQLWREFWVSLASLLRSYTAAHGLNRKEQATVELGEAKITVRTGTRWLQLDRNAAEVTWAREDGSTGAIAFTIEGQLVDQAGSKEEMDMQAEAWARELMQ